MAKEHSGHESEHEAAAEVETVRSLAEVIATQIEQQRELAAGLGGVSGSFDLAITYKEVEYLLNVAAPAADDPDGAWVVRIDKKASGTTNNLLEFVFADKDNWLIGGGLLAPVTIGSVTINTLHVSFTKGNPPIPVDPER
jgi:hypothetical protein